MGFMNINIFVNRIEFGIYNIMNEKTNYILEDKIIVPKSFTIGQRLSYIRKMINLLIKENRVKKAYMYVDGNLGVEIIEKPTKRPWGFLHREPRILICP